MQRIRWERLCGPLTNHFNGQWDFFGLNQRTPFPIYLPSITHETFPPITRRELRALILVAGPKEGNPYGLSTFDVAAAVAGVKASLGNIKPVVLAFLEGAQGKPTLNDLCETLTASRYTLLHVVCHGKYSKEIKETVLYLLDDRGAVKPVTASDLLLHLHNVRGTTGLPYFTFLSACDGALADQRAALGGVAQQLVQAPKVGMPAVLAMTEKISVDTALKLSKKFYERLLEHGHLDLALVEACAGLQDHHDVNVPAHYSRLGARPLFTDTLDRPLTNEVISNGLTRMEPILKDQAPVLFPRFGNLKKTLEGTLRGRPKSRVESAEGDCYRICDDTEVLLNRPDRWAIAIDRSFGP